MHAKAEGRRILTFACVTVLLIHVAALYHETAGGWLGPRQSAEPPTFIAITVCAGLLIAGMVWWKGAAAMPDVILVLTGSFLIDQTAGSFKLLPQQVETQPVAPSPVAISIESRYEGTEVRCNGVLLGKTPLRITLDEFAERVLPAQEPPVQEAAFEWSASSSPDSLASMNWSALPFDPSNPKKNDSGTPTNMILKRFSTGRYFWDFRVGEFRAASDHIDFHKNNNEIIVNTRGWETLRRHAEALRTLAKEESVDPLVAYADHIDSHPPLRQVLTPPIPQKRTRHVFRMSELERFSKEPLGFEDAVMRRDWLWVARSNDPKSVPLLKWYLERHRRQSGDDRSLLHFKGPVLSLLMESEQPEIQQLVRNIMTSAEWPHYQLLEYYIERQLEAGVNREELTSWLAEGRSDLTRHFLPLLIRVAGSNFSEVVGQYSEPDWWSCMVSRPEVPESVVNYLAKQLREAPTPALYRGIAQLDKHPVLYVAISETDLSTAARVRDFVPFIGSWSGWVNQALSEAAAKAFAKATDQSHITELAQLLAYVPNDISLATLEAYAGPENKVVAECEQQVRNTLKRQRESLEEQLQLARDLLAGKKSSQDLVNPIRLEWKHGKYVRTQP
jgi:hypothetical protein